MGEKETRIITKVIRMTVRKATAVRLAERTATDNDHIAQQGRQLGNKGRVNKGRVNKSLSKEDPNSYINQELGGIVRHRSTRPFNNYLSNCVGTFPGNCTKSVPKNELQSSRDLLLQLKNLFEIGGEIWKVPNNS